MQPSAKKSKEEKLKILKSIIDSYPFGYTLMEIYRKFKDRHGIGSRNTLKKYLGSLMKTGAIRLKIIGNYKIFRSTKPFSIKFLFEQYPHLEQFSINLFSAITKVFSEDNEMASKGKRIGIEMARSNPILESKVIKQFQKSKDFFRLIPFQQFVEKLREKTSMDFKRDVEIVVKEDQAVLTFKDKKLLQQDGWIFYYILTGILETYLNEIFNQNVTVEVQSINRNACTIIVDKKNLTNHI